jgi:hypothetical protein
MNQKQLRRLRLVPGDVLLVRGQMPVSDIAKLRAHFDDKITVAQIPHRNFLERVPFEILERIYFGAKASFEAQQLVDVGENVRITFSIEEARALINAAIDGAEFESEEAWEIESAKAEKVAERIKAAIAPYEMAAAAHGSRDSDNS